MTAALLISGQLVFAIGVDRIYTAFVRGARAVTGAVLMVAALLIWGAADAMMESGPKGMSGAPEGWFLVVLAMVLGPPAIAAAAMFVAVTAGHDRHQRLADPAEAIGPISPWLDPLRLALVGLVLVAAAAVAATSSPVPSFWGITGLGAVAIGVSIAVGAAVREHAAVEGFSTRIWAAVALILLPLGILPLALID